MIQSFCKFFGGALTDPLLPSGAVNLELGTPNMLTNHVVELYAKVSNGCPVTMKNEVVFYNMEEIIYLCSQMFSLWLFPCICQYSPWLKCYLLDKLYPLLQYIVMQGGSTQITIGSFMSMLTVCLLLTP